MIPLTFEENRSYCDQKVCYICKKKFGGDDDDKNLYKVRDHCHLTGKYSGAAHNNYNLRYKTSKKFPVVFHNGSTYDNNFTVKEFADKFDGQIECLGENTVGICNAIHKFENANNKYMKNYDENKESLYIQYLYVNNLYGWAKCKKVPVDGFEWVKIYLISMKNLKTYKICKKL